MRKVVNMLRGVCSRATKTVVLWAYICLWAPVRNFIYRRCGRCRCIVLLYHRVCDDPTDNIAISVERFVEQLDYLEKHCDVVDLPTILQERDTPRTRQRVAITFDDGYEDNYHAAKLLRERSLPATFFISTRIVGTDKAFPHDRKTAAPGPYPRSLSWEQIEEMSGWGFHFGNHTTSHANLAAESPEKVREEISNARDDLVEHLGPTGAEGWLAYPFGRPDDIPDIRSELADLGVDFCFSAYGGFNGCEMDPADIRRQPINGRFSLLGFRAALAGWRLRAQMKLERKSRRRSGDRISKPARQPSRPPVVILGMGVTGLACARAIAKDGVQVYGASLSAREAGRVSGACRVVRLWDIGNDHDALCDWLIDFANMFDSRPVVLPTSDSVALMIAQNRDRLSKACRIWDNNIDQLDAIVSKHRLYREAEAAGVLAPPSLTSPTIDEVQAWIANEPAPYMIKPYYVGADNGLDVKNKTFDRGEDLLRFIRSRAGGAEGLIIQRILRGGDGWIFDCYGLADRDRHLRVMATHRRIRQYPPDFGITCFGEIPARGENTDKRELLAMTENLLTATPYHGILGIEWLLERDTGKLYLLDFNARPFYTIGHLSDSGLNLPLLAYRELCDEDLGQMEILPELKHLFWLDFWQHVGNYFQRRRVGRVNLWRWLRDTAKARSFAIWDRSDIGPAIAETLKMMAVMLKKLTGGS